MGSRCPAPRSHLRTLLSQPPLWEAAPLYLLQVASPDLGMGALTWEVKGHGPVASLCQQLQRAQLLPCVRVKGLSVEQQHLYPVGTRGNEGPEGEQWPTVFLGLPHYPPRP